jgi:2-polyprenyl-3-methyl-5-hydroxy-6-metoxy-1,4-benzoquinol methylase
MRRAGVRTRGMHRRGDPESAAGTEGRNVTRITYRQPRSEMLALLPERYSRVLEIGCDEGDFAAGLHGEVWGVEPEAEAATVAATRLHRVLVGTFLASRAELPLGYFDVVVCNDVIEHMVDHDHFLREIRAYMAPGGALIGSVPNMRHYRALFELLVLRDWDYRDTGVLDRTHLRWFTARSLRRSLERAGFAIERFQGVNGGIRFGLSRQHLPHALFGWTMIALTLGCWRDIRYMQFAFRVRAVVR